MRNLSVEEFRKKGYLQELNRQYLHPLGLALSVMVNQETGEAERFGPIRDARSDPQGIVFPGKNIDVSLAMDIDKEWKIRAAAREKALGFVVQPAPGATSNESSD